MMKMQKSEQKSGQKTPKKSDAILAKVQEIADQRHIPAATYRLQFHAGFTFNDAKALVGYLDELGISDLYGSPIFMPRMGSTHGYDVADPTRLNSDLGRDGDFDALAAALRKRDMGFVLDVVPNHMGINDARNQWWLDVLENGPSSEYAPFFDIQWQPIKQEMVGKVLLPILGDQYGVVLERGELRLTYHRGSFYFSYYETVLPLSPRSYMPILRLALEELMEGEAVEAERVGSGAPQNGLAPALAAVNPARLELESILTALSYLPPRTENDPEKRAERAREKEIIKRRLDALYEANEELRTSLDGAVQKINGVVGKASSFDLLDELVTEQAYRLAFWRVAGEEINYRRFFDINDLAAIRVEDPQVFAATHALAFRLLAEGKVTGLRVDHPDGLYDPVTYFCRLQEQFLKVKVIRALQEEAGPDALIDEEAVTSTISRWLNDQAREAQPAQWPLYVAVEKILSESEPLPLEWAVSGTTGYSFLAAANGIFVDQRHEKAFTRLYSRFSGNRTSLREMTFSTKMMIMRDSLAGEISTLAYELERIGERHRHYRDFTLGGLRTALREVIASLGVYRTYIDAHQGIVSARDQEFLHAAVRDAKRRHPLLDGTLFTYIEDTLLLKNLAGFDEADRPRIAEWVMKFQQLTGPVMAKGVEDTAFYRYNRLVSLNEVGDHPGEFGLSVKHFHAENSRRAKLWPHTMLATSTHDNKRSEDVRARINVLSEMPDLWQTSIRNWSRLNASKKQEVDGEIAPDANDEYLFYQIVLGVWPLAQTTGADQEESAWGILLAPGESEEYQAFRQRVGDYMLKAVKEAKIYTSWLNPNQPYENAVRRFVDRVLQPGPRNRFLADLAPLARVVAHAGQFNALAQTLLKFTTPGVPDIYQGNELWDFSLVDPDNRRPVAFEKRSALLKELKAAGKRKGANRGQFARELVQTSADGRIKLFVTQRALHFRREHGALFAEGAYVPLEVVGPRAEHVCAFLRHNEAGKQAVVIVPRLVATLGDRLEVAPVGAELWGDTAVVLPTALESGRGYHNVFTDEHCPVVARGEQQTLSLAAVLGTFPVALLALEAES